MRQLLKVVFQFHRVLHTSQDLAAANRVLRAILLHADVHAVARAHHAIFRRFDLLEPIPRLRTVGANELVRIHTARVVDHACRYALRSQNIQRAQRRLAPRAVAVVADPDLRRVALHQPRLFLCQRRAQRGDDARDAVLQKRHRVHIPFHEYQPFEPMLLTGEVQRVETVSLVEHRRVRRVQVLGIAVAHDAPAKAEHLSLRVQDGKDDALAEHIVPAPVPLAAEPRRVDHLVVEPGLLQRAIQRIAAVRRRAKAEAANVAVRQTAGVQILERHARFINLLAQLPVSVLRDGRFQPVRHRHVRPVGQKLHRLHEFQVIVLHNESYDIAALVATKAVKHLTVGVHLEGRRLFVMERATGPQVSAFSLQLHALADDLFDAHMGTKLIQPCGRKP